jgi:hypothetical protein
VFLDTLTSPSVANVSDAEAFDGVDENFNVLKGVVESGAI